MVVEKGTSQWTKNQEGVDWQDPCRHHLIDRKLIDIKDNMILEDCNEHHTACIKPEENFECCDQPLTTGWDSIRLNAIDDQCYADPKCAKEEAFVWMAQRSLQTTFVEAESCGDEDTERDEEDQVENEDHLADRLQTSE